MFELDKDVLVAVDFDGTITTEDTIFNDYPKIDKTSVAFLKLMQKEGAKLILWTCRENEKLKEAIKLCEINGLFFDYINSGNGKRPDSRKVNADVYIDEKSYPNGEIPWIKLNHWIEQIIQKRSS